MEELSLTTSIDTRQQTSSLVRRADWRFLLPTPPDGRFHHLFLLGGHDRLGDWLVDTGFADSWSHEPTTDRRADVAAVLDDANVDLRQVTTQLAPGGVLYYEWSRLNGSRMTVSPARMCRALQHAGFTVNGVYAVRPSFRSPELFLPLDAPHALKWYVETLYPALTAKQRLLEGMLATTTRLQSNRFAAVAPFVAIVATSAGHQPASPAIFQCPGISSLLSDESREPIVPLMLTDGGNRVALLPFTRQGREPSLVVKVPKLASFNDRTVNEQTTLAKVRRLLSSPLSSSIPSPLGVVAAGDISVSVENFLPGSSMLRSSGRWGTPTNRRIEDLRLATDWLCKFHQETIIDTICWSDSQYERWFETLLDVFRTSFGVTDQEAHLFAALRRQSNLLTGLRIPIVWQHRDFNVWNVFRNDGDVSVIDWEGGRPGLPLCDLLHFSTHWNDAVHGASSSHDRASHFRSLFCAWEPNVVTTSVVHQMVQQYAERLHIDHRFVPMLLVYTWLELAVRRHIQLHDMGETRKEPRENNQYFDYLGLLANHADRIFNSDN